MVATPSGLLEADVEGGEFVAGSAINGELTIAVVELRSGNPLIDRETRRRLQAKRYPTIRGELASVVAVDGPTATVKGTVTFLGRHRELEGDIKIISASETTVRLAGSSEIDVQNWGLEPPTLMVLRMDPVVTVSVDVLFQQFEAWSVMPLRRSAARRASRKDEVLPLLGWNGGAEDAAPCSITLTFALHQLMVPSVFARSRSPRR